LSTSREPSEENQILLLRKPMTIILLIVHRQTIEETTGRRKPSKDREGTSTGYSNATFESLFSKRVNV
jgi:hypothetical protein